MSHKINSFTINGSYIIPLDFTLGKTPVADVDKFMTSTINKVITAFEMEAGTWIYGKFFTEGYYVDESGNATTDHVYYDNVIIGRYATFTVFGTVVNCIVRAYPPDYVKIQTGKKISWSIELAINGNKFNTNYWREASPNTDPLIATYKVEIIEDIAGGKHFTAVGYTPEAIEIPDTTYHFSIRPVYDLETYNFFDCAIINSAGSGIMLNSPYANITNLNNTYYYYNNSDSDATLSDNEVLVSTITAFDKYYSPGCGVCGNYYADNFYPDNRLLYKTKLIGLYDDRDVYAVRRDSYFDIFYFEEDENSVI